ncbi:PREDICTED: uncharacterized protein LOC109592258 [Amphimedon queenslandica]|uniref:Uncharacterized protein n=3 Tax=Amphimedon queenslandica TaxID=400682 RepID=A0AAN0K1B4_AMPQE|nr:PREDICTED: uncharacterized protein LOC109592258 [Amphimedon queenslandica]|eukprot:XP_019863311.1 PREDICTED: uncharacterized protein LOC109592258 [Amphimedon queenslandica]
MDAQDIDLSSPRFFVYALNGAATFNTDGTIARIGRHPSTPIVSDDRITLGTAAQCPGVFDELNTGTDPTDTASTGTSPPDTVPTDTASTGTSPPDTVPTDTASTGPGPTDGSATMMLSVFVLIFCTLLAYLI